MKNRKQEDRLNLRQKREILEIECGWDPLPRPVGRMKELTSDAKLVYQFIMGRIREYWHGKCTPSIALISLNVNISESGVRNCIRQLKKVGLIHYERHGMPPRNSYYLRPIPHWILQKYGRDIRPRDALIELLRGLQEEREQEIDNRHHVTSESSLGDVYVEKENVDLSLSKESESKRKKNSPRTGSKRMRTSDGGEFLMAGPE